jgi:stalled ribosome alternative rescue factor ArfA
VKPNHQAFAEEVVAEDVDAMDIDSGTPPVESAEKSRQAFVAADNTYKPGTPIKFGASSRTAPSSPQVEKHAPANRTPNGSATDARPSSGLNDLTGLKEPLTASTNGGGLAGLSDLKETLPFKSKASTNHPTKPQNAQKLKHPSVPGAPTPPVTLDEASTRSYFQRMEYYVREYRIYNKTMLSHFAARDAELDNLDGTFVRQRGEKTSKIGFGSYLKKMKEDEKLLETWKFAQELHLNAMRQCEEVRNKTMKIYAFDA